MARMKGEPMYQTWEQVDTALRAMGEIDITLGKLEGEMTLQINEIRAQYDTKAEGFTAARKSLEVEIALFAEAHKEEFARTRSKELTFGTVAYRIVHRVAVRSIQATIAALRALSLDSYIRTIEQPDKEAMATLDAATLAKVGATLKTEDKLRIEPNIEKIKDAG